MTLKLLKFDPTGFEPVVPHLEGEEIQKIDFGRIDPWLDHPNSILCLMLQTEKDDVVSDLKIYALSSSSIPAYKIWYSPSSSWIGSPDYEMIINSSSEIPYELPVNSNLSHISGSSILSGSSYSGSSQYIHLMLEFLDEKYPFGVYQPNDLQIKVEYNDII